MRCFPFTVLVVALACPAYAGEGDPQDPSRQQGVARQGSPDFLFGRPKVSIGFRGSLNVPRAESDWYTFVTDQLTIDRGDFRSAGIVGDVGVSVAPRLEAVFGGDFTSRTTTSEYRHFAENGLPILQNTRLMQTGITGGVRFSLSDPGRPISSLAWIPAKWIPYVGGGGGAVYYEMSQAGDFVDVADFSIFTDVFDSNGWAPMGYLNGGVHMQLARRLYLTVDARYQWAESGLDEDDWQNFEPLDLTGLRFSTGINVIF